MKKMMIVSIVMGMALARAAFGGDGDVINYAPAKAPKKAVIVVAKDSKAREGKQRLSALELMTDSERARYFELQRILNPAPQTNVIVIIK